MYQWKWSTLPGIFVLLVLMSCGSSQKSVQETKPRIKEKETQKKAEKIYPSWFNSKKQKSADTLHFYGYGMAVAKDSVESARKALALARSNLREAVDDSLEKLRSFLINQEKESADKLKQASFIVELRNSVSFVEKRAKVAQRKVKSQENRWISFIKTRIPFKVVKQQLQETLSSYPSFTRALN